MGSLLRKDGALVRRNGGLVTTSDPSGCECCCPAVVYVTLEGFDTGGICDGCYEYSSGFSRSADSLSVDGEYELPRIEDGSDCTFEDVDIDGMSAQLSRYNTSDCSGTATVRTSDGDNLVRVRFNSAGDAVDSVIVTLTLTGSTPSLSGEVFLNTSGGAFDTPLSNERDCESGAATLAGGGTVTVSLEPPVA